MPFRRPALALLIALALLGASCSQDTETVQADDAREQVASPDEAPLDGEAGEGDPDGTAEAVARTDNDAEDAAVDSPEDVASDGDAQSNAVESADDTAEPAETPSIDECTGADTASSPTVVLGALAGDLRDVPADELAARADELAAQFDAAEPPADAIFQLIAIVPEIADVLADQGAGGCLDILLSAMTRLGIAPDAATGTASSAAPTFDMSSTLAQGFDLSPEDADCVVKELQASNSAPDDVAVLVAMSACENA